MIIPPHKVTWGQSVVLTLMLSAVVWAVTTIETDRTTGTSLAEVAKQKILDDARYEHDRDREADDMKARIARLEIICIGPKS